MGKLIFAFMMLISLYKSINVDVISGGAGENAEYEVKVMLDAEYDYIVCESDYIYAYNSTRVNGDDPYGFYYITVYDYEFNIIVPPGYTVSSIGNMDRNSKFSEGMLPVIKDGKYGYLNDSGDLAINAVYDDVRNFNKGVAIAQKDGLWGVINADGDTVIDFLYSYIDRFTDGKSTAQRDGVMGILNLDGYFLELPYQYLGPIINGYIFASINNVKGQSWGTEILVWERNEDNDLADEFGIIDTEGNIVYPFVLSWYEKMDYVPLGLGDFQYDCYFVPVNFTEEGVAFVKRNDKYGIINTAGEVLYEFVLDEYMTVDNGYIGSIVNRRVLFNKYGKKLSDLGEYDIIESLENNPNLFIVYKVFIGENGSKNTYGVIDINGKIILPMEYFKIYQVNGGKAIVGTGSFPKDDYELIDMASRKVLLRGGMCPISDDFIFYKNEGEKLNYITDWNGNILRKVNWKLYNAAPYEFERADDCIVVYHNETEKRGVINKDGNIILDMEYDFINYSNYDKVSTPLLYTRGKHKLDDNINAKNRIVPIYENFDSSGCLTYYFTDDNTYNAAGDMIYDYAIDIHFCNDEMQYYDIYQFHDNLKTGLVKISRVDPGA